MSKYILTLYSVAHQHVQFKSYRSKNKGFQKCSRSNLYFWCLFFTFHTWCLFCWFSILIFVPASPYWPQTLSKFSGKAHLFFTERGSGLSTHGKFNFLLRLRHNLKPTSQTQAWCITVRLRGTLLHSCFDVWLSMLHWSVLWPQSPTMHVSI